LQPALVPFGALTDWQEEHWQVYLEVSVMSFPFTVFPFATYPVLWEK
jgi:hypothetical protein